MTPPPPDPKKLIPKELQDQLDQFKAQLWKIKITEALIAGLLGLLLSFLLVFLLDRFVATPPLLRLAILLCGTSLFAIFAPYWVNKWVFKHQRENQLARLISQRYPRLGDRLLGIIELQGQEGSPEYLSPDLRRAAMVRVAAQAKKRDLKDALPASRKNLGLGLLAALAALIVTAFIIAPKAGTNAIKRWAMPLADIDRYTFTHLHEVPETLTVPYGEPFTLTLRLKDSTEKTPPHGQARYGKQNWLQTQLQKKSYTFNFLAQQKENNLQVQIGDATPTIRVKPVLRPAIESVIAQITLPSYLQRDPTETDLRSGNLAILEGSTFTLDATTTRSLKSASLTSTTSPLTARIIDEINPNFLPPAPAPPEPATPTAPTTQTHQLKAQKNRILAKNLAPPTQSESQSYTLQWTDNLGLQSDKPLKFKVTPYQDQTPTLYLQGIDSQIVILEEDTIDFEVLAEDDFGLQTTGLEWRGKFNKPTDDSPAVGEMTLAQGDPHATRLSEPVTFSPGALGIQPQILIIRAYAKDYFPERGRIYSQPLTVHILTRDEHAQLVQNQFSNLIGELEDAARREQTNLDENERLDQKEAPELRKKDNAQQLENQLKAEEENREQLSDLAQQMEELFKQAVKNGEIPKENLKKLEETRQSLKELSQEDLPKVEDQLQKAQDQNQSEDQNKKDLKKAIEEQKKAVEKMRDTIEKSREANQNLEAATFINRLRRVATRQKNIGNTLDDSMAELAGRPLDRIDPADLRLLNGQGLEQRHLASDTRWIQEDLEHFSSRSDKEIYGQLAQELRELRLDFFMEDNSQRLVEDNHTTLGADISHHLAELITQLAKKLDDSAKDGGGGGGEGGGPPPGDEDFEYMLKLMKLIQSEQGIRSRTRAIEQLRRNLLKNTSPTPAP